MDRKVVCYSPAKITQNDNPLDYSFPLFLFQLSVIFIVTRGLWFILRPLRQPRVIAEILSGVLLGPSVLGTSTKLADILFPLRSTVVLETMAHVGLLYFMFLVGVEMDLDVIKRTGKRALLIAVSGMFLSFTFLTSLNLLIVHTALDGEYKRYLRSMLFISSTLSITAFPVLPRILAELKLLNTELGRMAMSSALICDAVAWAFLSLSIVISQWKSGSMGGLGLILATVAFVVACIFVVRPIIVRSIQMTPEGEPFSEFFICLIVIGVMLAGFITDAIGTHSILGAFVFGLIIPTGALGVTLHEKLEDFVTSLLLPLFFTISGLRTNVWAINGTAGWIYAAMLATLASIGKVVGTLVACLLCKISPREGFMLGFLMNSKGIIVMIVLNIGKTRKVLNDQIFAILILSAMMMTSIIMPSVSTIYRTGRRSVEYKRRTIQHSKSEAELRILTCIHAPHNVPTTINLLEASNPTKTSPIRTYVLHLVELTGRSSAMQVVHKTRSKLNRTQVKSDLIFNAFENYESRAAGGACVSVHHLTAISPYSTMHEDICNLAEDKRAAFVIIPFHKQQSVDGGMEELNPAFRTVNENLLANAPCSVGILVDRGLSGSSHLAVGKHASHRIGVLFFGGPDDREALSYALRMSELPGNTLIVTKFIPGDETIKPIMNDMGRQCDDECIQNYKLGITMNNDDSIHYNEIVANNGEETVAAIRAIEKLYDLVIVGRGRGVVSPLTAGLTDWSECPELGAIGDILASSDFGGAFSVLVVQQYVGPHGDQSEGASTRGGSGPDHPDN